MDLSEYILEPLRKDEDFSLYRGRHRNPDLSERSSILLIAHLLPHPASSRLEQAGDESSSESEPETYVHANAFAQFDWRPALVLENAGDELFDALQKPINTEDFLRIAEKTFEQIKRSRDCLKGENVIPRERVDRTSDPALEIKRLQRCMNDLIDVLALPAAWRGRGPAEILSSLADWLMGMLALDFFYARITVEGEEEPLEILKAGASHRTDEIARFLDACLRQDHIDQSAQIRRKLGEHEISIFPVRMGVEEDLGFFLTGSLRLGFPEQTERVVLRVGANQTAAALQQRLLLSSRKRVAIELDQRVAERTRELAETIEELQLKVGLLQHFPVSAWTLKPDGTPDFVNRVWLEFSGQTLDFVRSHPEAWMTAVHPEDREMASRAFGDGVRCGKDFAIQTRSLRAQDGVYRWHLQQAVVLHDAEGKVLKFVGTTTDIDDQKRAEEALRASEAELRQVIDNIPGLVSTLAPNGETKLVNRQILEYFGKTPEELKNWKLSDAIHPADLPHIIALHTQSIQSGASFGSEYRLRRVDGVYRWFQFRAEPVRNAAGSVSGWYVLATDIHDRKQAEEALQASERNFASIINTIPTLAWSARPDGCCDFLSQGWLDFTGLTTEEAHGWGWLTAFHPEDRDKLVQNWQSAIATGVWVDTEARLCRFDGVYRWTLIRANPWRSESGAFVKWYGTNTDIDDRKRAEEQVQRSEAFLAEAQHLTRVGSFAWCVSTGEIRCSEQLYRIFEVEPGTQLTTALVAERIHPNDLSITAETVERAHRAVSDLENEYRIVMHDGSIKRLHFVAHATHDREGRLEYIGAVQDVTQRRIAEEALIAARQELDRVTRIMSLGVLTASIAHEVNQPLSGIVTNAGTCLRMLDSDPPNIEGARETAVRMIRDGNRASEVVTRLRSLFRSKEVAAERVDLNDAAREVIALSSSELESKQIIVRHEFAENLPAVKGDRIQLQQVIQNLLRNASDSMISINSRPRHLMIKTESGDGKDVHVTVQDTGIGIPPEAAGHLFDPLYTTKEDGMGIGLSVSRSIVEAHQGQIWATTNDGPGSSFTFSIPSEGY